MALESIDTMIDELCQTVPAEVRNELCEVIKLQLGPYHAEYKAADGFGDDKYAYLWSDLLAWDDLLAIILGTASLKGGVVSLGKIWAKHRSLRVKLTRQQFEILRAVKGGANTLSSIMEAVKGTVAEGVAKNVIPSLCELKDGLGRPVLHYDEQTAEYSTIF